MWELQELELQLEDKCEKQGKLLAAAQSCAAEPHLRTPGPQDLQKEFEAVCEQGHFTAIDLTGYVEPKEEEFGVASCPETLYAASHAAAV
jgi:hypothetical protein